MVNIKQAQPLENGEPELAKFDDIRGVGFVLLQYCTDNGRNGNNGKQADGKAHRTEEFKKRSRNR